MTRQPGLAGKRRRGFFQIGGALTGFDEKPGLILRPAA
jgi:hypothetical protein